MTFTQPPDPPDDHNPVLTDDEIIADHPGSHRMPDGRWCIHGTPQELCGNGSRSASPPAKPNRYRERLYEGTRVTQLAAPTPLVDGLLFMPGESVIYSPPKLAKTFFALDLALSVATGQQFMGRDVLKGPALFVAAEGVGGLGTRVDAWRTHHGHELLPDAWFLTTAINLLDRASVDQFLEIAGEIQPVLVVLDTLARCTTGAEENSAKDMGQVVEALDRIRESTRGHVSTIHHAGKDTTKGMRGSSALLGAVDTVIELSGDSKAIQCRVAAQKDAEPADSWFCTLTQEGFSAVITETGDSDVAIAAQNKVLAALEQLPQEDRTSTKWAEMAEEAGISRRHFFRAKDALQRRGWVTGGGGRGTTYQIVDIHPEED